KYSDADTKRLRDTRDKAADKFRETLNKTRNFNDRTRVLNVDVSMPECIPAEQTGGVDIVRYVNIGVACGTGDKDSATTWIQTGELIQVGPTWRVVDAPREGLPEFGINNSQVSGTLPDEVQKLVDALVDFDKAHPVKENPTAKELID